MINKKLLRSEFINCIWEFAKSERYNLHCKEFMEYILCKVLNRETILCPELALKTEACFQYQFLKEAAIRKFCAIRECFEYMQINCINFGKYVVYAIIKMCNYFDIDWKPHIKYGGLRK